MPLPYYMFCKQPAVRLVEIADGRFQPIERGVLAPFMAGYHYLLVENELAAYLQSLNIERVAYSPATLFIRSTGEELHTHTNIKIGQFFMPNQINDLAISGMRLLSMGDEYFFCSPELRECLASSPFSYLSFSEGLSGFAGNAT